MEMNGTFAPNAGPVNRISAYTEETTQIATETEISPAELRAVEKEIAKMLKQIEPVYAIAHELRQFISKYLFQEIRTIDQIGDESGFIAKPYEPKKINKLIAKLEQAANFLNLFHEDMRGSATELTAALRRISLTMQGQLQHHLFDLKTMAPDGYLSRSGVPEFFDKLLNLQMVLGNEEVNLELMRGRVA